MDSDPKYIGKGVVLILTAVILIFLMVYFINNKPGRHTQTASSADSATGIDQSTQKGAYGVRIGDNLKGFLRDADFFDIDMNNSNLSLNTETGSVSSAAEPSELKNQDISFFVQAGEGKITITFVDESSCVITGQRISIVLSRKAEMYTAKLTYIDEDGDGVIEVGGLSPGIWEMSFNTLLGYQIPTEVFEIALDVNTDALEATDEADDTDSDSEEADSDLEKADAVATEEDHLDSEEANAEDSAAESSSN